MREASSRLFMAMAAALPALLGYAAPAAAIVNMESLHLQEPKEGFNGFVELDASGASGNTNKTDFGLGTRLEWHHERRTTVAVGSVNYGRASGAVNTDNAFLHLRHIYQSTDLLAWEGFAQLQRDRFARLSLRQLLGGGARFTLRRRSADSAAFVGTGAFYEREDRTAKTGTTDETRTRKWRGNLYWVFKHRFREGVHAVNSLYYQPNLDRFHDFRALDNAELQVDLTELVVLKIRLSVAYDSEPPQTVKETDVSYHTGLAWSF
jgi:putative salt-induced outer membrane protein YdiY